jgi:formate dehydrogenase iron-sulfur subunit
MTKKTNNTCNTCASNLSRRDFLKVAGTITGGLAASAALAGTALASSGDGDIPLEDQKALLYDATYCVGCRECELACKIDNNLKEEDVDDLAGHTWTLIKLYQSEDGEEESFRKYQCMHCVNPACVTSCPVGALEKTDQGPVVYESLKCIGCRYCMQACPYGVPAYDWSESYPLIAKCDLCFDRHDGTACALACAPGALVSGTRGELLKIAKERIVANPGKYHEDRVFGEHDGGGTSVLILSAVSFDKIGLPPLTEKAIPHYGEAATRAVPYIFGGAAGLTAIAYRATMSAEERQELANKSSKKEGETE